MSYSHVQSTKGYASASSQNVSFGANVAANNLLVVLISAYNGFPVTGISDTRGNTWTQIGSGATGSPDGSSWLAGYYAISNGAGADTVTVNFTVSSFCSIILAEYSGIVTSSPVDAQNKSGGSSTAPSSSATTTNATDLVIGWYTDIDGTANSITVGSGYTERQKYTDGVNFLHAVLEDKEETSTGSKTANLTISPSAQWLMGIAAFKESGAAPATPLIPKKIMQAVNRAAAF